MATKPKAKRGLIFSDTHCGHVLGLTPPDWDPGGESEKQHKARAIRVLMWTFFERAVRENGPFDFAIHGGDAIDGRQEVSKGLEIILPDRNEQVKMAADIIKFVGAKKNYMAFGTEFHTGKSEDWEESVADRVGAQIGGHNWVDVNGLTISFKHHVGGSQVPHGRSTAIARERLWELLWAERGDYPKADLLVRSHVHYYSVVGGQGWLAFSTPCLQGYGGRYGRRLSGMVDIGVIVVDVIDRQHWSYKPLFLRGLGALRTRPWVV